MNADYVIVGAGSAGCVLANRLSANPNTRVVVIEAGGRDTNPWIHIPLGYGKTINDKSLNWGYETEPEPHLNNRRIYWPRGRVIGGSSSINGLVYIRGQVEDYDHWRQLGNAGWSFEDVLPYFKRSQDQQRGADALHAVGGPLGVSDLTERTPLCEAYIHAAMENGLPRNEDFNGATQEGVGYYQLTTRRGRRSSAATAFLKPAMKRPNLTVVMNALATRILFEGKRAVGIAYRQDGVEREVRASAEVILAGGSINSPQLMMLSGVGPAAHLAEMGIPVVQDMAGVGGNLQDHYQVRIVLKTKEKVTLNDWVRSPLSQVRIGLQYALFRTGPLTISAGQVGMFARTRRELASPDVQYHLYLFSADRPAEGLHKFSAFTTSVCQLRPESRGQIRLKTNRPEDYPAIHANYLADPLDQRTVVDGIKLGRRIAASPVLKEHIAEEYLPGPKRQSDEEILDFARNFGGSIFHPVGTCKMGSDPAAVVDTALRVHGIGGLRVVDASIMPTLVSGNTNAAAIMIGEKASDLILGKVAA